MSDENFKKDFELNNIDRQMINLLDNMEQSLKTLDLGTTPQYVFTNTVSNYIRDYKFERLPGKGTRTRPFPETSKNLYMSAVYGMTVKISGVNCSTEDGYNRIVYYGKRFGKIACVAIQRYTEQGLDENAIAGLLSDMSFSYEL